MIWRVLPLVVLLGCSQMGFGNQHLASAGIHEDLQSCPVATPAVPIPPLPRTFDAVVDWGKRTEEARAATAQSLEICRAKLIKLLEMVKS